MSMIEKLTQFMDPFPSLPASSSSSSSSITASEANPIQERFMEDLRRLSRMLRRIQALLQAAEEREISYQTIQLWLSEIREVAYEAEDVLEEYDYQVIKTQVEGMTEAVAEAEPALKKKRVDDDDDDDGDLHGCQASLPSSTSIKIPISYNMAERIMKIIAKFDEIEKDREALQLRLEDAPRRLCLDDAMKRPPSSSFMHDSDVFGREDDKKNIIQSLMSDPYMKENDIIPIVGLGGVGKTTLAQLIYNDPVVCKHFNPKVWIHVSEEFDVLRVTKEILKSIQSSSHDDNDNLNDLQHMLKKALRNKRFLLILDDVWNERPDMWEALRVPFSGFGMGKIIVTTRSMSVARIMQTVPPHELGCLGEDESWLLFQRHAFCGWEPHHQLNFEHIGRKITKKCDGLPLALKAIGRFLQHEVKEQIWKDVLNNNLWELEETKNIILPALRISYNYMPGHLKPCFVYASLFPKNHQFKKVELIKLWIAQGYIQLTGRKRLLEDIASEYFEELQRRSLFQCSINGKYLTLHDMVHDLARSISRNELCSLLDFDESKNIPIEAKHIFIKHAKADYFPLFGAIRTFCGVLQPHHFGSNKLHQSIFLKNSFSHFGCLRVLRLEAPNFECSLQFVDLIGNLHQLRYLFISVRTIQLTKYSLCNLYKLQTLKLQSDELNMLPRAIGKLINLRHLVIHCNSLKMLPKSICQLENLLTLDIEYCSQLRELPLGISKLTNLLHLIPPKLDSFYIPYEIEKMISLQTLPRYYLRGDGQYSSIGCLKHLMNLRGILSIYELQKVVNREDAKSADLQSKPHIERLTLFWRERKYDECTRQEAILDGLQPHTNLKELTIDGYEGKSFPSWFGDPQFSNLTKVSLVNLFNYEERNSLPLAGLPSLKSLEIINIKGIRIMDQDFWCYNAPRNAREKARFHLLEYRTSKSMPAWKEMRPIVKNGGFSSLTCLFISYCHNLKFISTLPSSLVEFEVKCCRTLTFLQLRDSSGPLSKLQKVKIKSCDDLYSVTRFRDFLSTLKFLQLDNCRLLNLDLVDYFSLASVSSEKVVRVIDCPMMRLWCENFGLPYEGEAVPNHANQMTIEEHVSTFVDDLEEDLGADKYCTKILPLEDDQISMESSQEDLSSLEDWKEDLSDMKDRKDWKEDLSDLKKEDLSDTTNWFKAQSNFFKDWIEDLSNTKDWKEDLSDTKVWKEDPSHTKDWKVDLSDTKDIKDWGEGPS